MLNEFRECIARGNVIDLAVGIVVGAAFGKIVDSLVDDVIMPPLGLVLGRVDFSNLFISLTGERYPSLAAAREAGAASLNYGLFLNTVVQFLIVSLAVFLLVKQYNRLRRQAEPGPPTDKACPSCQFRIPAAAARWGHCTAELAVVQRCWPPQVSEAYAQWLTRCRTYVLRDRRSPVKGAVGGSVDTDGLRGHASIQTGPSRGACRCGVRRTAGRTTSKYAASIANASPRVERRCVGTDRSRREDWPGRKSHRLPSFRMRT